MKSKLQVPPQRNHGGFTLIELMITISILAILLALAVPSFQTTIASSNLSTATSDLVATLAQARSNAIRRGARVTVCKSTNGTSCVTTGDWSQGWIMFNDDDHSSSSPSVDTGEVVTFVAPAITNNVVIKSSNLNYVSFAADGLPKNMDGSGYYGTIRVCSTSTALQNDVRTRDLVINRTGRVVVKKTSSIAASCPSS